MLLSRGSFRQIRLHLAWVAPWCGLGARLTCCIHVRSLFRLKGAFWQEIFPLTFFGVTSGRCLPLRVLLGRWLLHIPRGDGVQCFVATAVRGVVLGGTALHGVFVLHGYIAIHGIGFASRSSHLFGSYFTVADTRKIRQD
jgi:hypothetical protein